MTDEYRKLRQQIGELVSLVLDGLEALDLECEQKTHTDAVRARDAMALAASIVNGVAVSAMLKIMEERLALRNKVKCSESTI